MTRLLRQFVERGLIRLRGSAVWIRDEPRRTTPSGTRKPVSGTDDPSGTTEEGPGKATAAKPAAPAAGSKKGESGRRR